MKNFIWNYWISIDVKNLDSLLSDVKEESNNVDTVFSVCVIGKVDENNKSIYRRLINKWRI